MGSYFFLLKHIEVLEREKCSHSKLLYFNRKGGIYVETWRVFLNSGEVITTVMVQKAVFWLVSNRYCQLLLKDQQKDYSTADDREGSCYVPTLRGRDLSSLLLFLTSLDLQPVAHFKHTPV